MSIEKQIADLQNELPAGVTLVAVSKTHPVQDIERAYAAGQRVFGESRPQEMKAKYEALPKDIEWHMIGHLQTNKVRMIAPFVGLVHSVDSPRLLEAIDKEGARCLRVIDVLLEVHIAREESKFGWDETELAEYLAGGEWRAMQNVRIRGVMGIASFTDDMGVVKEELIGLKRLFDKLRAQYFGADFDTLSMGMTSDYQLAIECGSNMVRIGSLIFGQRYYGK